jgi:formate hydrogenlyase transcriptional activator
MAERPDHQRSSDEATLVRLASEIAAHTSVDDLLRAVVARVSLLSPFDDVGIALHDRATGLMRLAVITTPLPGALEQSAVTGGELFPIDYGPAGWVWERQERRYDRLDGSESHPTLQALFRAGYRSVRWVPLTTPRARLGTIVFGRRAADHDDDAAADELAQRAAHVVALATEHALQVEALDALRADVSRERDRAHELLATLKERVKELTALHEAARLLEDDRSSSATLMDRLVALLPPAFQFPVVTQACIQYGAHQSQTQHFGQGVARLSSTFATRDGQTGQIVVEYTQVPVTLTAEPFLPEERHLLETLAEMIEAAIDRRIAEQDLKDGEARLLQSAAAATAERDRAELLLEITTAVVSELDLTRLLRTAADLLRRTLRAPFAAVAPWDAERKQLDVSGDDEDGFTPLRADLFGRPASPAGVALAERRATLVGPRADPPVDEATRRALSDAGIEALCCAPMCTQRGMYGVVALGRVSGGAPFDDGDVRLIEQVARQVAVGVENAVAYRRAERYQRDAAAQRDRLRLLLDVNNALVSQIESHSLRLSVLGVVRRVLSHDYAALTIVDDDGRTLRIAAQTWYDARGVIESGLPLPIGGSPAGLAFQQRAVRTFAGTELDAFGADAVAPLRAEGLRVLCSVPLITQRGVLGTLEVARRAASPFTDDEVTLLRDVAAQVAIAVANTLAYQEISALKDRLTDEKLYLEDEITLRHDFTQIIGNSQALRRVLHQVQTVATTDTTVLLLGETGTGKELLARALHDRSRRRAQTFVRINGAAMPTGLIESELFGYEKGAFTGATSAKVGRLELAHRGSLFLDEVGDLPIDVQPKLLRALQEQEFERLGGTRTQKVDVRLVAATNRDLHEMVGRGAFRGDLYYRLSVFPIEVPPLRERTDDIVPLVQHFVRRYAREMNREIDTIPAATMDALQRWHWPGNIRELQNVVERAVILSPGTELHVPRGALEGSGPPRRQPAPATAPLRASAAAATSASALEEGERALILTALRDAGGRIAGPDGAAARLGIKRTTLHSKMRKLGIERPSF